MDVKAAIENTKYYLNKNGKMQTGWQKIGGKWYYMDKNGALQESKWISGIYYVKVDGQSVRLMKDRKLSFLPVNRTDLVHDEVQNRLFPQIFRYDLSASWNLRL